jgi:predicted membrane channel-forming protein YqfA (hemolysin III family)
MELLRQISGHVLLVTSLIIVAFRYVVRAGEGQNRRVYRIVQWPFAASGLTYAWLEPWHDQGPNPFHIIVFIALGLGALALIDDLVDRYRERRRGTSTP